MDRICIRDIYCQNLLHLFCLCEFSINRSHFSLSYISLSRLFHTKQDLVPESIRFPVVLLSIVVLHNGMLTLKICQRLLNK